MERGDEQRLIRRAQRGDAEAFAELYRAYVQVIFRYIAARVNDLQLAEDLTGDVFTKALEGLGSYRDRGRPFLAWLYRIARARVIDHYRQVGRRPSETSVDDQPLPVESGLDAGLARRQAAQALRAAIAGLTDDQQRVIILRFVEGYRVDEVAAILGKQPNAIKALQFRALRALAGKLERAGIDISALVAEMT
ncbi:MAG: sigma-70 family RNA polymerase sigma factor [Aggregatilineales bacterium]